MNYFIEIEKNEGLKQSTGSALPLNIPASMPQDQIPKKADNDLFGKNKKIGFCFNRYIHRHRQRKGDHTERWVYPFPLGK